MRLAMIRRRDEKAASAIPAVFNTTELLEKILLRTDMKTLLLAQRVCRKWKAVIGASSTIQKKLFMVPVSNIEEAFRLGILRPPPFNAPITRHAPKRLGLPHSFEEIDLLGPMFDFTWHSGNFDILPNPMLDFTWTLGYINIDQKAMRGSIGKRIKSKLMTVLRNRRQRMCEPSWTRMLATQPPRREIRVLHYDLWPLPQTVRVAFFEWVPVMWGNGIAVEDAVIEGLHRFRDR
ncbi:hypothetical protein CLAFUW4_06077 [Fulvia fulva]|uniref:F-box domain-containing protein n=1 Tax=Passalora fulva TaxID=5499 RepID=A0A9Q8LIF0_PASFU|nr:uncharacterized protein CLAFUR5_06221 [Fulvia fulva]KAK4624253.1 hypothetical protein CLAFUR4_06081 [Fulvia fulva]KAK4625013.1 hypothetical protein CLAFUR0_06085 [Fulvia fulva]UJO18067.1 hypothetical protein CLAFUR5_06221 [Fulvia fulva]WPV14801.1 hypothetical protein CLAFUW4_06077 [Fulvia fulva]WPV29422.1 hypothetical protein CLAFUW7_06074 [Fulvia fulva]